jgi:hypothetical protein
LGIPNQFKLNHAALFKLGIISRGVSQNFEAVLAGLAPAILIRLGKPNRLDQDRLPLPRQAASAASRVSAWLTTFLADGLHSQLPSH